MDPLANPENGKITINAMPSARSLAAIQSVDQLEDIKHRAESEIAAQSAFGDPVSQARLMAARPREEAVIAASFSRGDRAYHKVRKQEVLVREMDAASGRVRVKLDTGAKIWVKASNLVRL